MLRQAFQFIQKNAGMRSIINGMMHLQWKAPPQLEALELTGNKLTKLSFAARLGKLTHLNLEDNSITSIEPLLKLPRLRLVNLRENPVLDWSPADQMQDTVFLRTM